MLSVSDPLTGCMIFATFLLFEKCFNFSVFSKGRGDVDSTIGTSSNKSKSEYILISFSFVLLDYLTGWTLRINKLCNCSQLPFNQ